MSVASEIGRFSANVQLKDVPWAHIQMVHRAIHDVVGVTFAGKAAPFAAVARARAQDDFRDGPCRVLGTSMGLSAPGAAFANAVAAHALDFDANFSTGMVFAPAILFSSILATAEQEGASGADVVLAFSIGAEICRVLGASLSELPYRKDRDGLYYRGWFNSAVLGPIATAAALASILKLDQEATTRAVAIAAVSAGGLRNSVGTDMKPYLCGRAAEAGVRAAYFARDGVSAPHEAFEGGRGLIQVVGGGRWTADAFAALGQWEDPGISIKLYPACSSIQAATEAFEHLIASEGIERSSIARVHCGVTRHIAANLAFPRPTNVTEAQFSMPFAIACVLVHGRFTADLLNEKTLDQAEMQTAMAKVEMAVSPSLDNADVLRDAPEATEVSIEVAGGRRLSHVQMSATGRPGNPASDERLEQKFVSNLGKFASPERIAALSAQLRNLEREPAIRGIFDDFSRSDAASMGATK